MPAEVQLNILLKPDLTIGPETIALLGAIAETGSITAAARATGISYKKAWHIIDRLNTCLKKNVVTTSKGGDRRGGATLTETGAKVMALYRPIHEAADARQHELRKLSALAK